MISDLSPELGDTISLEFDLRSSDPEQRKMHLFVNNIQEPLFLHSMPAELIIGLQFFGESDAAIEFISLDMLETPSVGVKLDARGFPFDGEAFTDD